MTTNTEPQTMTNTVDAAPMPTGKVRKPRALKAPRAGSITGYLLRGIHGAEDGTTSRALVDFLKARHGIEYPIRAVAATLAILRARGVVASVPIVGDEVGRHAYRLTERGAAIVALMPDAPVVEAMPHD